MATKNFQVTIGYKSVVCIDVKAETEEEAKKKAIAIMSKEKDKMFVKQNVNLQDDSYKADGVLNMDETWNML
jgi:hypothetical protein